MEPVELEKSALYQRGRLLERQLVPSVQSQRKQ